MRVNPFEEYDSTGASKSEFEARYRAIKERIDQAQSAQERSAANEELIHSTGQLLAFCCENNIFSESADDPIVDEILTDGISSETPHLLHKAFQTCMAFGKTQLSLAFGTGILESQNKSWSRDYEIYPDLQAAMAELYVMTKQPDRAITLLLQCIDWPGTHNIMKSAYHEQIARCYRISGQDDKERHHIKLARHFKSLPDSSVASGAYADEDGSDEAAAGFARFKIDERGTVSGDFLIWLGDFANADQLAEYVTSDSDDWEPASPLNSAFGFALLEGQGYGDSELSYAWAKRAQKVKEFLAPLGRIAELPELAAKEALRAGIKSCNSAVVFHDANRTFFVENPFPSDSPLRYLGRFSYAEPRRFAAVSTDPYASDMRLERAAGCLAERHFIQAETFLRAELAERQQSEPSTTASVLLKLCLALAAHADEMYQFAEELERERKFQEAMRLFAELVNGGAWSPGLEGSDDLSAFFYHCENYAVRLENNEKREQAFEIYKRLFDLSTRQFGDDDNPENQRWKLAIDRCSV